MTLTTVLLAIIGLGVAAAILASPFFPDSDYKSIVRIIMLIPVVLTTITWALYWIIVSMEWATPAENQQVFSILAPTTIITAGYWLYWLVVTTIINRRDMRRFERKHEPEDRPFYGCI